VDVFATSDAPDYSARLEIEYPERLSHSKVLVKSWLLAIPHLVIATIFVGAAWGPWYTQLGLIMALVLVVAYSLLFVSRYPEWVYDLVMGLNRWVLRVAAYVALMNDRYPPFRLDQGAHER
jgi:Domain of unknown function (DUF4389)